MSPRPTNSASASRVRRRALAGTVVLVVLVALAGLAAYLTRDGRAPSPDASTAKGAVASASPDVPSSASSASPVPNKRSASLPGPPVTHDPITFGRAAAEALWSYDTRSTSQAELLSALRGWLTTESAYADRASVDAVVPSPVLWKQMAANGQFATATVNEGHFPDSFTRALQADPGAITTAYLYAVTVSGKQSIAWNGSGGAESRSATLAVQCRPDRPCALVGVLPSVAP